MKLLDGNTKEIKGVFSYDIKLNFGAFLNSTDEESKKLLASEILKSLSKLDALPKKIKDFDWERFKADMEAFFHSEKLI